MRDTTITGTVTHTVVVGSHKYHSPLTIDAGGAILPTKYGADGIYVPATVSPCHIDNAGTVDGGKDGGVGIDSLAYAVITNSGTITGGDSKYSKKTAGGAGVALHAGGILSNSGSIHGGYGGGYDGARAGGAGVELDGVGRIVNTGSITGGQLGDGSGSPYHGGIGVVLLAGGVLQNEGTITGGLAGHYYDAGNSAGAGVDVSTGATVFNSGHINGGDGVTGSGAVGVNLHGGTLVNEASGVILGGSGGGGGETTFGDAGLTGVQVASGTLVDLGSIIGGAGAYGFNGGGPGADGVTINGGSVFIQGSAIGGVGQYRDNSANSGSGVSIEAGHLTVTGTITGGAALNQSAQHHYYAGAGLLMNGGTAVAKGTIMGGAGGTAGDGALLFGGTLSVSGTIAGGVGANGETAAAVLVSGKNVTVEVAPGAVFDGAVTARYGSDVLLLTAGTSAGTLTGIGGQYTGFGSISVGANAHWVLDGANTLAAPEMLFVHGNLAVDGQLGGPGTAAIDWGGTLTVDGSIAAPVLFTSGNETLATGAAGSVSGTISGFAAHDIIHIAQVATSASFDQGTLSVLDGATTVSTFLLAGSYTTADFTVKADAQGGTDITVLMSGAPQDAVASGLNAGLIHGDSEFVPDRLMATLLHSGNF